MMLVMVLTSEDVVDLARLRSLVMSGAARLTREANGLSLREVGSAVGVADSTILRWERCERRPTGAHALKYLRLLDSLIGGSSR